ncbi:DELTA-stichotoxin-Hcr4a-like [Myxocyprinus asiaticus]|uniref:DELTA-stichotoxin-Hcr4a-like n=1 Tax=Myxocyprinus asiaticus TaxID=70543 RepID=UPI0022237619|nr:DELTA-stichotoxin-Hcr4a-like [Myxocyprinus asiaticus]XP_051566544.1 DELTA-stichotoxin-Hcr4a-like [Myxocyprinus asiaticus]
MEAAALASVVIAGASLAGSTIEKISNAINTERNVTIHITNFCKDYNLTNPRVFTSSGYSHDPPQPTIKTQTMEACSFTKNPNKQWGCVGVLTYDVCKIEKGKADCCLAIMFSVPYDYDKYENWFAVGIFDSDRSCDESLFNLMYYESGSFSRDNSSGNEIKQVWNAIEIKGTMSPRAKSIMKVEVWDY